MKPRSQGSAPRKPSSSRPQSKASGAKSGVKPGAKSSALSSVQRSSSARSLGSPKAERAPLGGSPYERRRAQAGGRTTSSASRNSTRSESSPPSGGATKFPTKFSNAARKKTAPKKAAYSPKYTPASGELIRINKFLADAGIGSRRKVEELIEQRLVKVNGETVIELGLRVHLGDLVTVNGEPVNAEKHLTYILLNKPKDYITTTSDEKGRKTVMDLLPSRTEERIYPVGRLDRNTTGVLLLTNDGEMAHRLMHPSYQVTRVYSVYLDKRLAVTDAKKIAAGVEITLDDGEDYTSSPCEVLIDPGDATHVSLAIGEGKNREVRRIFESLGYEVARLDRKSYATLTTRGLARGEYRHLNRDEVHELERLLGLDRRNEQGSERDFRRSGSTKNTKSTRTNNPQSKTFSRSASSARSSRSGTGSRAQGSNTRGNSARGKKASSGTARKRR